MPYERPTLTALREQVAEDINAALPGADARLRYDNPGIMGEAQAGLAHQHYGYLDYIAKQAVPFTSEGEVLEGWAGLKRVFRLPATNASGTATFTGTPGKVIPSGSQLVRGDGVTYTSTADATVGGGGSAVVSATADADPQGKLGTRGNAGTGELLSLAVAIDGINGDGSVTTPFTGGSDVETDQSLRGRMLQAFQDAPEVGDKEDYERWAREVAGVTRAWCKPHGMGGGTVVIYIMLDIANAAFDGYPQGTDGVSQFEDRPVAAATGDQLAVADHIFGLQPVTALIYVVSPVVHVINFTISGLSAASLATKAAVAAAIDDVFVRVAAPGVTIDLSDLNAAIAAVPLTAGFIITVPATNVAQTAGQLPKRGTVTYV